MFKLTFTHQNKRKSAYLLWLFILFSAFRSVDASSGKSPGYLFTSASQLNTTRNREGLSKTSLLTEDYSSTLPLAETHQMNHREYDYFADELQRDLKKSVPTMANPCNKCTTKKFGACLLMYTIGLTVLVSYFGLPETPYSAIDNSLSSRLGIDSASDMSGELLLNAILPPEVNLVTTAKQAADIEKKLKEHDNILAEAEQERMKEEPDFVPEPNLLSEDYKETWMKAAQELVQKELDLPPLSEAELEQLNHVLSTTEQHYFPVFLQALMDHAHAHGKWLDISSSSNFMIANNIYLRVYEDVNVRRARRLKLVIKVKVFGENIEINIEKYLKQILESVFGSGIMTIIDVIKQIVKACKDCPEDVIYFNFWWAAANPVFQGTLVCCIAYIVTCRICCIDPTIYTAQARKLCCNGLACVCFIPGLFVMKALKAKDSIKYSCCGKTLIWATSPCLYFALFFNCFSRDPNLCNKVNSWLERKKENKEYCFGVLEGKKKRICITTELCCLNFIILGPLLYYAYNTLAPSHAANDIQLVKHSLNGFVHDIADLFDLGGDSHNLTVGNNNTLISDLTIDAGSVNQTAAPGR